MRRRSTVGGALPLSCTNYDNTLSRFHSIPERNGRTDRQTDEQICCINIVSMLTRDKNCPLGGVWEDQQPPLFILGPLHNSEINRARKYNDL